MTEATLPTPAEIVYPDSDGEPMADNTLQFDWIVSLKENLELLFAADPDVFVGGNLLWYPVRGDNTTRAAPDTMVAFGRPKGYRGSYRQWDEAGVAPQVVFEVLSPGNRAGEMTRKFEFYRRFGVEEYYVYDPDGGSLSVWLRGTPAALTPLPPGTPFVSPRLRVRFVPQADGQMEVFPPERPAVRQPDRVGRRAAGAGTPRGTGRDAGRYRPHARAAIGGARRRGTGARGGGAAAGGRGGGAQPGGAAAGGRGGGTQPGGAAAGGRGGGAQPGGAAAGGGGDEAGGRSYRAGAAAGRQTPRTRRRTARMTATQPRVTTGNCRPPRGTSGRAGIAIVGTRSATSR